MITRFNVCDLNAIETRVGAWLAQDTALMSVFEPFTDARGNYYPNGKDPYLDFAGKMWGIPYEKLWADYKGWNGEEAQLEAKRKRQIAKPGVLGAIYRLSGGDLMYIFKCPHCKWTWTGFVKVMPCPNPACGEVDEKAKQYTRKTGLWDYADKMGVSMPQKQAHEVVEIFRNTYTGICDSKTGIWKQLEVAVADVMHPDHPNTIRKIGPPGAQVIIDRTNIEGRHPMMRMLLPSGRYLHYLDARLEPKEMPWKSMDDDGEEIAVFKNSLIYGGMNQKTKQWDPNISTHGGKLFENLVQGISRDILGVKLLEFEEAEMPVHGHVHDEGITLVPHDILSPTVKDMVKIMSTPVSWAPGLLLGADGFEDVYYHK